MSFRITGLSPAPFRPLFALPDDALAARGARRYAAEADSGFPCRVTLEDAARGERVLLVNYEHQPAATPYRAAHAIFVREQGMAPFDRLDEIPPALRTRLLSLRAFDADGMMRAADVMDGAAAAPMIERMLADSQVAYLHAHFAKAGCYAARITRV